MRILHVIPGLTRERGGPSAVVQALARHQAQAGHTVAVLCTDQGRRSGEQRVVLTEAVDVDCLPVRGPDRFAFAPGFAAAVRTRLRQSDIVHLHSLFNHPSHVTLREMARADMPCVVRPCGHLHRYSLWRSRWRKRAYLAVWGSMVRRACRAWHYTSTQEAAESWPWDDSPRFVVPNGIEPAQFLEDREAARALIRTTWPALGQAPYVLFLGRIHPKKRLDLLLHAFLASAPPAWKLVVAGPDECGLWHTLSARYLAGPAAAARVVRLGTVSGAEKAALLGGARLFALPSEHENFGIAALEALAAGTPVLLSPHVDLAVQVVEAGFGTTAPLDVAAWESALARELADPRVPEELSARARHWVQTQYAWDQIAQRLVERYQWVRAGCPAEPAGVGIALAEVARS